MNIKYIIIIAILLSSSIFLNAETTGCIDNTAINEYIAGQTGGHVTFYGVLDIWYTQSGALIIDCDPPMFEECYTLWWDFDNPNQKTVILNDADQTEIKVTSDPVITTGENGKQTHTFSR